MAFEEEHGIKEKKESKATEKKEAMARKMKGDRSRIKLGEGSLENRKYQSERANKDMRRKGTFYTAANKRAGLI